MNFLMTLFVGLATLVWSGFASIPVARDVPWTNSTSTATVTATVTAIVTATVGHGTGNPSGSLTTSSKTTSAEPSISTIPCNSTVPGNFSVDPIRWHLYDLQVFSERDTNTTHGSFQAVFEPDLYTAVCNGTTKGWNGLLDGVGNTECETMSILFPKNESIPVTVHFAWRARVHDNVLGVIRDLLVIKTNAPGSNHACPDAPHDACWAQGLYWIPECEIEPTDTGYRYTGPEAVHINGTYCRSGMEECAFSELLY